MIYRFEDFELDVEGRELRHSGLARDVEPQVFDLLHLLVSNHGKLVTKDVINEAIWNGRIVSEAALSSRVSSAREAIEDSGKEQRLIKTAHGHGFRFIGKPEMVGSQPKPIDSDVEDSESINSSPRRPSIAVLPFQNMSNDPEQEHVADGLSEDIITALSKISGMIVIARNSTFVYKGQAVDIKQVGREQGVRYVLEGSVRRSGNRFRITGQLIDAETGAHIWAHRYDREAQDIFELQDEMTQEIVAALQVKLVDGEQARWWTGGTNNFEAWEIARHANSLINTQNKPKVLEGRNLIDGALLLDPKYAGAHTIKAQSHYAEVYDGWSTNPSAALTQAKASLDKALKIDEEEPQALIILAMINLSSGKHDHAFDLAKDALKFGPSNALVLNLAAAVSFYCGDYDGAELVCKRAMQHCPMDRATNLGLLANLYVVQERYEEAVSTATTLASVSSSYIYGPVVLAAAFNQLGQTEEADRAVRQLLAIDANFSSATFLDSKPFKNKDATNGMRKALINAGLPE